MMQMTEVHISSIVVHARPEHLHAVKRGIEDVPGSEIHAESACGKLVVVLESGTTTHTTDSIERIAGLEHVLSTALVFHQIETLES